MNEDRDRVTVLQPRHEDTGLYPALRLDLREELGNSYSRAKEAVEAIKQYAKQEAELYEEIAVEMQKRVKEAREYHAKMGR